MNASWKPIHPDEDKFVTTALTMVKKAGAEVQVVRAAFEQPSCDVHTKASNTDLVTETDQAVEKLLIQGLKGAFPDHKYFLIEFHFIAHLGRVKLPIQIYWRRISGRWAKDRVHGCADVDYRPDRWNNELCSSVKECRCGLFRIPMVAICVGLAVKKQLRAGIVYNPITKELFQAQTGKGAFKNGFPIHVSSTKALNRSLICQSLGIHNLVTF
uniref:Uncharacterized protein n=1 Tax=Parascaris equorum TaxID=6256 RepID=A0A914RSJ7_PAREQ